MTGYDTGVIEMIADYLMMALGFGTPEEMVVSNGVLSLIFIASSFFTLGWTLVLLVFTFTFGFIGLLRLISPTFDKYWPLN